nr:hypothetical protein [Nostoc sp. ChiSLP01]
MFCSDRSSTPPEQEPPFLTVRLRSPSTLSAVEGLKFGVLVLNRFFRLRSRAEALNQNSIKQCNYCLLYAHDITAIA